MQGDIFQLEDILSHQAKDSITNGPKPVIGSVFINTHDDESPLIAVYNEDDVSEYLYSEKYPVSYTTVAKPSPAAANINTQPQRVLDAIARAFDDYYADCPCVISPRRAQPLGSHNHFSVYKLHDEADYYDDDECAISTDDEDDAIPTPVTPTHEIRHYHTHHIGSPPGSDKPAARPVLAKKKQEKQPRRQNGAAATCALAAAVAVPPEQHVDHIEGALMSWWPLPVEKMEHEWTDKFYE
ncbi:hypothetical protein Micbo1qcDRAFT_166099 [Microdochium bolleyi]|uniref:Uncharacterized protein n=1 Tax=Microdochium bolleyi TaxID=196109 RepID=A0A136IUU1_9PEZI|nr:hypothetical protein Micbo1qcDRAFT_166099 [Microdochium bolleyi]